jgi:hypothetical protein
MTIACQNRFQIQNRSNSRSRGLVAPNIMGWAFCVLALDGLTNTVTLFYEILLQYCSQWQYLATTAFRFKIGPIFINPWRANTSMHKVPIPDKRAYRPPGPIIGQILNLKNSFRRYCNWLQNWYRLSRPVIRYIVSPQGPMHISCALGRPDSAWVHTINSCLNTEFVSLYLRVLLEHTLITLPSSH